MSPFKQIAQHDFCRQADGVVDTVAILAADVDDIQLSDHHLITMITDLSKPEPPPIVFLHLFSISQDF